MTTEEAKGLKKPALKSLHDMRKSHIQRVIGLAGGDFEQAAKLLMITPAELRRWMRKMNIEQKR